MTFEEYIKKYPNAEIDLQSLEGDEQYNAKIRNSAYVGQKESLPIWCVVGSLNYNVSDLAKWFSQKHGWSFDSKAIERYDIKTAFEHLNAPIKMYERGGAYFISGDANHRILMGAAKFNYLLRELAQNGELSKEAKERLERDYSIEVEVVHAEASLELAEAIKFARETLGEILTEEQLDERDDIYAKFDRSTKTYTVFYDGEVLENATEDEAVKFVHQKLDEDQEANLKD